MWRVWETSCFLLLVILCLIGLRLRDSRLVIPSLGSLVLFSLVFNFLFFSLLSSFLLCTFCLFCALFYMPFLHKVA